MNGPLNEESAPAARERRFQPIRHAVADASIVASRARPLAQELHADLGIVDDGHAVGS